MVHGLVRTSAWGLLVFASCVHFRSLDPPGPAASLSAACLRAPDDTTSLVFVIGTLHAPAQFRSSDCGPAHVRVALECVDPGVVCVECTPERFAQERFHRGTWEAHGVAVPWARDRGLPVFGVDWHGEAIEHHDDQRLHEAACLEQRRLAGSPRWSWYESKESWGARLEGPDPPSPSFVALNGARFGDHWTRWLDAGKHQPDSAEAFTDRRHEEIAGAVARVIEEHPAVRVAVVIGAAHKADLERRFRGRGIAVGDVLSIGGALCRLSDPRLEERCSPSDAAAILGSSFDLDERALDPKRVARLLGVLRASGDRADRACSRYFEARHAQREGDDARARALFAELCRPLYRDVVFPRSESHWRAWLGVRRAAWFELARIAERAARPAFARGVYGRLLESIAVPCLDQERPLEFLRAARAFNAIRARRDELIGAERRPIQRPFTTAMLSCPDRS